MRTPTDKPSRRPLRTGAGLACLLAASLLGGCAQVGAPNFDLLSQNETQRNDGAERSADATPQSELQKATQFWGQKYAKDPRNAEAAVAYAQNLKAMGEKQQALMVLQQVSMFHSNDRRVASEYGRLALELDQLSVAAQLLASADDPARPDWRVVTARGTVFAKQGKYTEAIPLYERALTLAPGKASILNNLALAYTMSGNATKGEQMLRQAANTQGAPPKVRENLALVLGVAGKYEESKQVATAVMPASDAAANADLLRSITKKDEVGGAAGGATVHLASAKPATGGAVKTVAAAASSGGWTAKVASGDTGAAPAKGGPMLRETKD